MIRALKTSSAALILLFSVNSYASFSTFTDSTAFHTAISGYSASTLNFDNSVAGTTIANGGTLGGITFTYPDLAALGISMQILDTYSATSGANYLGTDSGGAFLGGDSFQLSFAPVFAIGMFFLSGDELFDDDISLTVTNASGTTQAFLSSSYESTLADGSLVYFLGLLDETHTFSSVDVASTCDGCYEFNVDDITTAVPLPGAFWLFLVGLMPLLRNLKAKA
ncbi:hypothetical protein [Methylotuvimicrobium sp.]|uniref:hypothetical protein n=1 Tax=Methylotuvimicrobium sp. TaxID=2822413 RepID=UPI003D654D7A